MSRLAITGGVVDLDARAVRFDAGHERALTSAEVRLLRCLAERPGSDVSRDDIVAVAWPGEIVSPRVVDFTVRRLRTKLEDGPTPRHVLTSYGHGYRFVPASPTGPAPTLAAVGRLTVVPTGTLDSARFEFRPSDGDPVRLTGAEAALLRLLAAALDRPVPRAELLSGVWGRGSHDRALDALVARLRAKLDRPSVRVVEAVKGVGFRLVGADLRQASNLPPVRGSYEEPPELAVALGLVGEQRLVTLLGPPGVGKTRLARELGWRWLAAHPGAAVRFCALAGTGSESSFLAAVAGALDLDPPDLETRIGTALGRLPRDSVLILDTFEHVLGFGRWIERWNRGPLRILVTSREALGIPGERRLELAPLAPDAAARLFVSRAGRAFDEQDVRTLVTRLDGLPLAIELAAARAHEHPPAVLNARLGERLDLLVRKPEICGSHHSTLRGALDWTWDLLGADEQAVLAGCAVFRTAWSGDAARAVTGRPDAEALLGSLADRSWVVHRPEGWTMLESVRLYGLEKLGGGSAARRNHARWHLSLVGDVSWPPTTEQARAVQAVADELEGVIRELDDPLSRGAAARALVYGGWFDGAEQGLGELAALALERGVDDESAALLWCSVAVARSYAGDDVASTAALAQADRFGGDVPHLRPTRVHAHVSRLLNVGRPAEAIALLAAAADLPTLDRRQQVAILTTFAAATQVDGDSAGALRLFDRAIPIAREIGDPLLLGTALRDRADTLGWLGRPDDARAALEEALPLLGEASVSEAIGWVTLLGIERAAGRWTAAQRAWARVEAADVDPSRVEFRRAVWERACVLLELGAYDRAEVLLRDAPPPAGWLWTTWQVAAAVLDRLQGHPEAALQRLAVDDDHQLLCRAGAAAECGRVDLAEEALARVTVRDRRLELVRALVDLRAGGAPERAIAVRDAGVLVPCDDGIARERPTFVSLYRQLLDRALAARLR